jgi:hypothetical protein
MANKRCCPRCGKPLPPDVPTGTCPACLLRDGLATEAQSLPLGDSNDADVALGFEPTAPGRVLDSLAHSIGSIPRVLLPDTAPDDQGVAASSRRRRSAASSSIRESCRSTSWGPLPTAGPTSR